MHFDLFSDELRTDPYPHYRRLRNEAPIYRDPVLGFYVVSRFEDCWA